jgi:hypothetical protein
MVTVKNTFKPVMSICGTCKQRFVINFAFLPDYTGFPLLCPADWNPATWPWLPTGIRKIFHKANQLIDVCRAVPESSQPTNLQQQTRSTKFELPNNHNHNPKHQTPTDDPTKATFKRHHPARQTERNNFNSRTLKLVGHFHSRHYNFHYA